MGIVPCFTHRKTLPCMRCQYIRAAFPCLILVDAITHISQHNDVARGNSKIWRR
nr:MAG TPA: hypothetical protein [Caudoviricetes sp.]